jgi:hypothetical protein
VSTFLTLGIALASLLRISVVLIGGLPGLCQSDPRTSPLAARKQDGQMKAPHAVTAVGTL